ncbi:MAG: Ig-like domain-containing protein [Opitutales bacterium]|nr:Ig-like domain-containing protein [Opitutales bacterium]
MQSLQKVCYSFRIIALRLFPFAFVTLCLGVYGQSNFTDSYFTVSDGQLSSPYYNFTNSDGELVDFSSLPLYRGNTYVFSSVQVSNNHPFMIGESYGDMESSIVSGESLTGTGGKITVSIPSDFDGSLYFFCTEHTSMVQEFVILTNPASTFLVSGGQSTFPFYRFTDGTGQPTDFSTFNLTRGGFYEFIAADISASHPFMIGESSGDMDSSFVSGGPLTGTGGGITVNIPSGYNDSLYHFCSDHAQMNQEFSILSPASQYQVVNVDWNETGQSFSVNDENFPTIQLFSHCHYIFKNSSSEELVLSTELDSTILSSSTVYNNGSIGPDTYLLFSPKNEGVEKEIFYYYNPQSNTKSGILEIMPYDKSQVIQAPTPELDGKFSYSLVVNQSNQIVAGAPGENSLVGSVYIYNRSSDLSYAVTQEIAPPVEFQNNQMQFGASLSCSNDLLAISAPNDSSFEGSVFLYSKDEDGNYSFIQKITSETPESQNIFGYSLSMTGDLLAVSTLQPGIGNGEVSLYDIDETDHSLSFQASVSASDGTSNDYFGYDIDLNDSLLVIGAPNAGDNINGEDSGAVYIFEMDGLGIWNESQKLTPSSLSVDDQFGSAVCISDNFIFIGALRGDGVGVDTGVTYIFEKIEGVWTEVALISPPENTMTQLFSTDLQSIGDLLISSSPGSSTHGLVYIYKNSGESSDWNLMSTLDLNQSSVFAGTTTFAPIASNDGMIIVGSPEESASVSASGGFQAFFNSAWTSDLDHPTLLPQLDSNTLTSFTIPEDSEQFIYDFNASHPFNYPLVWSIESETEQLGIAEIDDSSGVFQFSPHQDNHGTQSFLLNFVTENLAVSQEVEVIITAVNDTPIFLNINSDPHGLPHSMVGEPFNTTIEVEDGDGDSLILKIKEGDELPDGLELIQENETGLFKILGTPSDEAVSATADMSTYTFTLICDDSSGDSPTEQTFSLITHKRNHAPEILVNGVVVSSISLTLTEDFDGDSWLESMQGVEIYDPDGDNISFSLIQAPSDGVVEFDNQTENSNEFIIFTPTAHSTGSRSFQVRISDDDVNVPKFTDFTVSFVIESVNDTPQILSPTPLDQASEGILYSHTFEIYDPDENDLLVFEIGGLPNWLVLSEDNRTISGTPSWEDYNDGFASTVFVYLEDTSGARLEQSYSIFVIPDNLPPEIQGNANRIYYMDEDQLPTDWVEITLVATDPDESDTSFTWFTSEMPSYGQVSLVNGVGATAVTYTPDGNFSGIDVFSVSVAEENDINATDTVSFTVVVNGTEDTPAFQSYPHYNDAIVEYPWEYQINVVDGDVGQTLTLSTVGPLPPWLSLVNIQSGEAILRGIPPAGQEGEYSIELDAVDDFDNRTTQSFSIRVISENTAPLFSFPDENTFSINEDEVWESENAFIIDPENQKISSLINSAPKSGSLDITINVEKEIVIKYVPDGNYTGSDDFSLLFTDGINSDSASFGVTIKSVDDRPCFFDFPAPISLSDDEDLNETIIVHDGDTLSDLQFIAVNKPDWVKIDDSMLQTTGIVTLSGSPSYLDEGQANITFTVIDETQLSDSKDLLLHIFVDNYPPDIEQDEFSITMTEDEQSTWLSPSFSVTDDHTLSGDLHWGISGQASHGTASIDTGGTDLVYQPDSNFSGVDFFTIEISDNGAINSVPKSSFIDINVTVNNIYDAPIFLSLPPSDRPDFITWNDESEYYYEVEAYTADSTAPEITCLSNLPPWLKFVSEPGTGKGILSGLAKPSDIGRYKFKFEATDGTTVIEQSFDLTIRVDNYPPVFYSTSNNIPIKKVRVFMDEDGIGERGWVAPQNFLCYDPDPEKSNQEISWSVGKEPQSGSALVAGGTGVRPQVHDYTPSANLFGYDAFYLNASDGVRNSQLKVEVYLRAIPDEPYFTKPTSTFFQFQGGGQFTIPILAEDEDSSELSYKLFAPDWSKGDDYNLRLVEAVDGMTLSGSLPDGAEGRSIPITISVLDESGAFATTDLTLEINGTNQAPVIQSGNEITMVFSQKGTIISGNLNQLTAVDPEGDRLTWEVNSQKEPTFGQIILEANNGIVESLSYLPDSTGSGTDSFVLRVTDGKKYDETLITIIILEDDSPPTIIGGDYISAAQNEFLAVDFQIVHSGNDFDSFITDGPDWLNLEKISSHKIRINGTVPKALVGLMDVSFTVVSSNGRKTSETFTVEIVNVIPPFIQLVGDKLISLKVEAEYHEPGYFASSHQGADLTERVRVSPQIDFNASGVTKLIYEVSDDQGNTSGDFRIVQLYDKSPLNFSHATYLNSSSSLHALLSDSDTFFIGGTFLDDLITTNSSLVSDQIQIQPNQLFIGELDTALKKWNWRIELSGNEAKLGKIIHRGDHLYCSGIFAGNLNIGGKIISSNSPHSFFVSKITTDGDTLWTKTFQSSHQAEHFQIEVSNDSQILLGGSFRGKLHLNDTDFVESHDESLDIFLLTLNPIGEIQYHAKFGKSGDNILSGIACNELGVSLATNVVKPDISSYGLFLQLDQLLQIKSYLSFESDHSNKCKNLKIDKNEIYLSCDFTHSLTMNSGGEGIIPKNEVISYSEGNSSVIMHLTSDFQVKWLQEMNAKQGVSTESIELTPFGNVISLISFSQSTNSLTDNGGKKPKDLSILKLQGVNGEIIWEEPIIGDGNEENTSLAVNKYGSIGIMLESDGGVILDSSLELNKTDPGELMFIKFESDFPIVFKEVSDLALNGGEFFSQEIILENRNFAEFSLVRAPQFISIQSIGSDRATISGLVPNTEGIGDIIIRAYDTDGARSDLTIDYQIQKKSNLVSSDNLPSFHSQRTILGSGKIIDIIELDNQKKFIIGNALTDISYQNSTIKKLGLRYGFILLTNPNLDLDKMVVIKSSSEVVISSAARVQSGGILVTGTFKKDLFIGGKKYFASNSHNVFIAELTNDGLTNLVEVLGSEREIFSSKVSSKEESLIISGQIWGTYVNKDIGSFSSNGSQDGFLALLHKNELKSFRTIGGSGLDEIIGHTSLTNDTIVAGNFEGVFNWGNEVYSGEGKSSFISKLKGGENEESIAIITSSGYIKSKYLRYNSAENAFFLSGEYDGTIKVKDYQISSISGLDVFIGKFNLNLECIALVSVGGEGTDRLTDFEIDSEGDLLFSATYTKPPYFMVSSLSDGNTPGTYIAKLDAASLGLKDIFNPTDQNIAKIETINPIRQNNIIFTYSNQNSFATPEMYIGNLGSPVNIPAISHNLPHSISANSFFTFNFSTGPWIHDTIFLEENSSIPSWLHLDVDTDGAGALTGQPPKSDEDISYVVSFDLSSSQGERFSFYKKLLVKDSSRYQPRLLIAQDYTVKQFEEIEIVLHLFDPDNEPFVIHPVLPDWLSSTFTENNKLKISGIAPQNKIGAHKFSVLATDSSGLTAHAESTIIIEPNLGGNSTDFNDLPKKWNREWIGVYATTSSGWSFHTVWGWSWFSPNPESQELWFCSQNGNWYWSSSLYWDGETNEGFLYEAESKSWIFCRLDEGHKAIKYDYNLNKWSLFP